MHLFGCKNIRYFVVVVVVVVVAAAAAAAAAAVVGCGEIVSLGTAVSNESNLPFFQMVNE